jgi:2-polyprenyl-3-methyl-5-hydroxy-6-metoxy-1,4-benzoquinol methylase
MSHFDEKAKTWDEEPRRVALASAIARAVATKLDKRQPPRLLDYGCGTGLCSLPLAGQCASVLGVDSSTEMLAQLAAKARAAGFAHVATCRHDLTAEPLAGLEFDIVLCAMTLHHVRDTGLLLRRLHALLAPGGLLALADLDAEDGSFHQDTRGVEHHGFRREWITEQLQAVGFSGVSIETAHEMEKPDAAGVLRRYPVFLATAKKPL